MSTATRTLALCLVLVSVLTQAPLTSGEAACPAATGCSHCPEDSSCDVSGGSEQCQCDSGYAGKSNFNCYEPVNKSICYVMSDPNVYTLQRDFAHVNFFGSAKIAHVITDYLHGLGGKCQIRLHAWTTKVLGKFYVKGMFFSQSFTPPSGPRTETIGGAYGTPSACDTEYRYFLKSPNDDDKGTVLASTAPGTVVVTGAGPCGYRYTISDGGFFVIENSCCGLKFAIRTHHPHYRERIPGLYFQICSENKPKFYCWGIKNAPLCLEVERFGTSLENLREHVDLETVEDAMTYYGMTNSYYVKYPGVPRKLKYVKNIMRSCYLPKLRNLFRYARFMLSQAHFVRCIASTDDQYAEVLYKLVTYYCHWSTSACEWLKARALARCGHLAHKIDGLTDFTSHTCP